jgi:hypothetical protein
MKFKIRNNDFIKESSDGAWNSYSFSNDTTYDSLNFDLFDKLVRITMEGRHEINLEQALSQFIVKDKKKANEIYTQARNWFCKGNYNINNYSFVGMVLICLKINADVCDDDILLSILILNGELNLDEKLILWVDPELRIDRIYEELKYLKKHIKINKFEYKKKIEKLNRKLFYFEATEKQIEICDKIAKIENVLGEMFFYETKEYFIYKNQYTQYMHGSKDKKFFEFKNIEFTNYLKKMLEISIKRKEIFEKLDYPMKETEVQLIWLYDENLEVGDFSISNDDLKKTVKRSNESQFKPLIIELGMESVLVLNAKDKREASNYLYDYMLRNKNIAPEENKSELIQRYYSDFKEF